jgi:cytosine/uracil/thiamine/allantoin permease
LSTSEPEELAETPSSSPPTPDLASPPPTTPEVEPSPNGEANTSPSADLAAAVRPEVTFVPMAVTVGDGFKFGCGFFMAFVLTMLIGFVLLAALFALNGLIGLNLPLGR